MDALHGGHHVAKHSIINGMPILYLETAFKYLTYSIICNALIMKRFTYVNFIQIKYFV